MFSCKTLHETRARRASYRKSVSCNIHEAAGRHHVNPTHIRAERTSSDRSSTRRICQTPTRWSHIAVHVPRRIGTMRSLVRSVQGVRHFGVAGIIHLSLAGNPECRMIAPMHSIGLRPDTQSSAEGLAVEWCSRLHQTRILRTPTHVTPTRTDVSGSECTRSGTAQPAGSEIGSCPTMSSRDREQDRQSGPVR